jgi:hypothetical protein
MFYPFLEGVSTHRHEPDDSAENSRIYEESQEQRKYERSIRNAKRNAQIYSGSPENQEQAAYYRARTKELQSKLRGFIKETGRTRRYDREAIYG